MLFQHYLSECRLYLEAVPVTFRLELLENIFSLLFLSTADLTQRKEASSHTCSAAQEPFSSSDRHSPNKCSTCEVDKERQEQGSTKATPSRYLDLGRFVQGCKGFLPDVTAVEGFLKLLKDALEAMCVAGPHAAQEAGSARLAERIGCSVKADAYGTRLQRLSKHIAEAQWRLQIITRNHAGGSGEENTPKPVSPYQHVQNKVCLLFSLSGLESPVPGLGLRAPLSSVGHGRSSSLRTRKRAGRRSTETQTSTEKPNGEGSSSPSGEAAHGSRLRKTFCLLLGEMETR